jgi:cytochrome b involved in lipid metabolism
MELHQSFSQIGAMGILSFVATAIGAKGGFSFSSAHARVGIPICAVLILQIIAGWVVRIILPRSQNHNTICRMKRFHAIVGFSVVLAAISNCYLGLLFFVKPADPLAVGFLVYTIGFTFCFVGLAIKRRIENRHRTNVNHGMTRDSKNKTPVMTYATFVKRVEHGQQLVLIGGNVYNVRDFINKHPGGAQVLMDNVGTDCTNVFDSTHKHSVAAVLLMNKRMLEGYCLEFTNKGKRNAANNLCLCGVSVCTEHFKRFELVAKEQIGGTEESPIVLFRVQVSSNENSRTASMSDLHRDVNYDEFAAEGVEKRTSVRKSQSRCCCRCCRCYS